ncbi:MAG: Crp/Fnr family transcriptional regulator [Fusobacteriaceae bacterium]
MKTYLKTLRGVFLFNEMPDEDILKIITCLNGHVKNFERDEEIFMQGEKISEIGIILEGEVYVNKDDFFGNRNIITQISPAGIFGEAFVLANISKIPVTVTSKTPSKILFINFKKVFSGCSSSCNFCSTMINNMLQSIAKKNVILNEKLEILSKRTTREKIISYLETQAIKSGAKNFVIPFSRQELADFLNVDRSALSRELSKLKSEGLINFEGEKFSLIS